jgi:hypothetical protein
MLWFRGHLYRLLDDQGLCVPLPLDALKDHPWVTVSRETSTPVWVDRPYGAAPLGFECPFDFWGEPLSLVIARLGGPFRFLQAVARTASNMGVAIGGVSPYWTDHLTVWREELNTTGLPEDFSWNAVRFPLACPVWHSPLGLPMVPGWWGRPWSVWDTEKTVRVPWGPWRTHEGLNEWAFGSLRQSHPVWLAYCLLRKTHPLARRLFGPFAAEGVKRWLTMDTWGMGRGLLSWTPLTVCVPQRAVVWPSLLTEAGLRAVRSGPLGQQGLKEAAWGGRRTHPHRHGAGVFLRHRALAHTVTHGIDAVLRGRADRVLTSVFPTGMGVSFIGEGPSCPTALGLTVRA